VQLAFARQGAKEQGQSDDAGRRLDNSYSPRRHLCSMFKPDGEAWVRCQDRVQIGGNHFETVFMISIMQ